jgi:hypothetical protein
VFENPFERGFFTVSPPAEFDRFVGELLKTLEGIAARVRVSHLPALIYRILDLHKISDKTSFSNANSLKNSLDIA